MEEQQHYSRKNRRALAKALGLTTNSTSNWKQKFVRSIEAGKSIDQQYKNDVETKNRNAKAEKEAVAIKSLAEKLGEEQALAIVTRNMELLNERDEKLAKRNAKQSK
jgi:hypothetical protein